MKDEGLCGISAFRLPPSAFGRAGPRPPVVSMVSLGCAKNTVDSERVLGMLAERGFVVAADPDVADVVLVNTCAFIAPAREETEETIRELARTRPVVAFGCYAERYRPARGGKKGDSPPFAAGVYRRRRFPGVAAFVAFDAYDDLPAICSSLAEDRQGRWPCASSLPTGGRAPRGRTSPLDDSPRLRIGSPATAYLKIAEGCSNRCSYCAVPAIRGPLRSVPVEKLVDEAERLADIGARELCVIAQDTASYGTDLHGGPRLAELLGKLCAVRRLRWVRLLYVHPAHLTDEILDVVAGERKMCRYLDLPVQHASDGILRAMGRRYDAARLCGLIEKTRKRVPGITLRTSVIVGFPGEGRREFGELLDFVKETEFDHLGAFAYSPEKGTRAIRMGRRPSPATARARRGRVMALQQKIAFARLDARVGGTETAMLELPCYKRRPQRPPTLQAASPTAAADSADRARPLKAGLVKNGPLEAGSSSEWIARTAREAPEVDGQILVKPHGRARPGRFVRVKIVARDGYDLVARPVDRAAKGAGQ